MQLACRTLALAMRAASGAATTAVECGLFRDYVTPDAGAATSGTIAFGVSGPTDTIAAAATLVPPTDTNLPFLVGGAPTCLSVDRDAGVITSLSFAPSGAISGPVILVPDLFGPGADGYVMADRLFAPVQITDGNVTLVGEVALLAGGDVRVGSARLPAR